MKTYLDQVSEWHVKFKYRQPEPQSPDLSCKKTNALRPRLLREELCDELEAALNPGMDIDEWLKNDSQPAWRDHRILTLDALCDGQYVLSGAVLAWGFKSLYMAGSFPLKPRHIHDVNQVMATNRDFIDELETCAELGYPGSMITFLLELQGNILRLVHHFKFQDVFDAAFAEVHRSNLSKVWKSTDRDEWSLGTKGDTWVSVLFEKTDGGFIGRREDGKILKSPSYSPANLAQFV